MAEPGYLTLNVDEVECAFAVPLRYFANPTICGSVETVKWRGGREEIRMQTYHYDDVEKGVDRVHAVSSVMIDGSMKIQSIESIDIEVQSIIVFIGVSTIDFGSEFEPSPTYK
jgi:hypothetical protein